MQCTTVNGSSLGKKKEKEKKDKIHWGPRCHRNWRYSLLPIINGGFCYYSILETSLSPVLHCRMQHRLPIHKYFITTGCCVSSRQITLGLLHPSPNSCCPVKEAEASPSSFGRLRVPGGKFPMFPSPDGRLHGGSDFRP